VALFVLLIRPRMLAALVEYWTHSYVPTSSLSAAAGFVGESLVALAGPVRRLALPRTGGAADRSASFHAGTGVR
jgi:hypothetical protein